VSDKPSQATPYGTLLEQIMNPCVAKNEREWAAAREINKLRTINAELLENLKDSNALLTRIAEGREWGAIEEYIQRNSEVITKATGGLK
jgi:hypothetical protein